ncbi:AlbA family DNA-binding domain-containing protein [Nucisporomicrobium flavum]|uniref:AlbA family DNA-binding domain-containing protein n=1 Tax=Nucisporomicrobium flavum TaxID=2785915 RepID=UPI001F401498|nr:ATP-binding protein [Nucisporomicrobium flavum]
MRSRRLEQILGATVGEATYEQLEALCPEVAEDEDLDFKAAHYGSNADAKKEICQDVAAMANTAGGLIVVGMAEDAQGRASGATDVELTDQERNRIRSTVASGVHPLPSFDVRNVENPANPGRGFMLIEVPRSVMGPHGVAINDGFRYPRRNGATRYWLSEPQVAERYRARFAYLGDRLDEARRIEHEYIQRLDPKQTFVVTTLVPDLPGDAVVTMTTFREFERQILTTSPYLPAGGSGTFNLASVRRKRFVATGAMKASERVSWAGCELHENGSGVFAAIIETPSDELAPTATWVGDQAIVHTIASAIRFLSRHARDRALTSGLATLRATIWPAGREHPLELVRFTDGGATRLKRQDVVEPPVADTVADLEETADDGQALLAATYRLAGGLFQEFGHPEAEQLTSEGALRLHHWNSTYQGYLRPWAEQAGIELLER